MQLNKLEKEHKNWRQHDAGKHPDKANTIYKKIDGNKNNLSDEVDAIVNHHRYTPTLTNNTMQVIWIHFNLNGKDITLEIDPSDTRTLT